MDKKTYVNKIFKFILILILIFILLNNYTTQKNLIGKEKKDNIRYCDVELDPFYAYKKILNSKPIVLCKSKNTEHICYQNKFSFFASKKGVICLMKNFYLNPSFWKEDGYNFDIGPTNMKTRGVPLISKGFFNMKCDIKNHFSDYNKMYIKYFNSWNYSKI